MILENSKARSESKQDSLVNRQGSLVNKRATSEECQDCKQETLVSHSRKQGQAGTDHMLTEHHELTPAEQELIAKVEACTSVDEPLGRDSFVI